MMKDQACYNKLAHLHFVAADEYRNRVIQLGELPKNVFNVGGLGVDGISQTKLIPKEIVCIIGCQI